MACGILTGALALQRQRLSNCVAALVVRLPLAVSPQLASSHLLIEPAPLQHVFIFALFGICLTARFGNCDLVLHQLGPCVAIFS